MRRDSPRVRSTAEPAGSRSGASGSAGAPGIVTMMSALRGGRPGIGQRRILSALLRQRRRLALATVAVALSVGYIAGALTLLDRVSEGLDDLAAAGAERADLIVEGDVAYESALEQTRRLVPGSVAPVVAEVDGVAAAIPRIEEVAILLAADGEPVVTPGLSEQPLGTNWPDDEELSPVPLRRRGPTPGGRRRGGDRRAFGSRRRRRGGDTLRGGRGECGAVRGRRHRHHRGGPAAGGIVARAVRHRDRPRALRRPRQRQPGRHPSGTGSGRGAGRGRDRSAVAHWRSGRRRRDRRRAPPGGPDARVHADPVADHRLRRAGAGGRHGDGRELAHAALRPAAPNLRGVPVARCTATPTRRCRVGRGGTARRARRRSSARRSGWCSVGSSKERSATSGPRCPSPVRSCRSPRSGGQR